MNETKGLKQKATTGVVWTAVQKYTMMFINFVSDIILARLLTPYDFGCIGMLAIFMVLSETLIDGGFGSALIQKKQPSQEDYSTVFFWNIGISILLYSVLYAAAPFVARFYDIPILSPVLRIQGLVLFVYAFNIIQRNQLIKKFKFKAISIVTVVSSSVALAVTLLMAYKGFGVWSLVAKNLISAGLISVIFWFYLKWRPIWAFSWQSFKELFSFGFYMFLSTLISRFSISIQGLLIGKVYNPITMGYYSKASQTEGFASMSISHILDHVTFPVYTEVQDDKRRMQNMIKKFTLTLAYVTCPLMFILILTAKPLFLLLYSEKWLQSVPYFQFLCLGGLAQCLQSVNFQTISAIGKSKVTFVWTLIKRLIGLGFIVGGLVLWGMKGLLFGAVLNNWFAYFVNIGLVSKHIGYKWYRQLMDLFPIALASLITAIVSYGSVMLLHLDVYTDGVIKLFVYVLLYMVWSFLFKPEAFDYLKAVLSPLLLKFRKTK